MSEQPTPGSPADLADAYHDALGLILAFMRSPKDSHDAVNIIMRQALEDCSTPDDLAHYLGLRMWTCAQVADAIVDIAEDFGGPTRERMTEALHRALLDSQSLST